MLNFVSIFQGNIIIDIINNTQPLRQSDTNIMVKDKRPPTIKFNITYYIIGCLKEVLITVVLIGMMF